MVDKKKISEWARSMSQLMDQDTVTQEDVVMLLQAHGLPVEEEIKHWTDKF